MLQSAWLPLFKLACSTAELAGHSVQTGMSPCMTLLMRNKHVPQSHAVALAGLAKALLQATVEGLIRVLLHGGPCRYESGSPVPQQLHTPTRALRALPHARAVCTGALQQKVL